MLSTYSLVAALRAPVWGAIGSAWGAVGLDWGAIGSASHRVEAKAFADEGASIDRTGPACCRGKEPVAEEIAPPIRLEFPYPHHIAEVREEE
ncbi:uncharacterized protein A4U43_C07F23560 [Asparagus officinalis]|uniref:Secreted protein n=1 Tax=Asparagus officinalis TaxID=4686 RepID=A0A5P1EEB9_ASPOF|nr:uncharacterized protein A4U43_C07F23560 [Asparagus officinalis]